MIKPKRLLLPSAQSSETIFILYFFVQDKNEKKEIDKTSDFAIHKPSEGRCEVVAVSGCGSPRTGNSVYIIFKPLTPICMEVQI